MTTWTLIAACLTAAPVLVGWTAVQRRVRRRAILGRRAAGARPGVPGWWRPDLSHWFGAVSPLRAVLVAAALAAGVGAVLGGPVAAIAAGSYAGLAAQRVLRHRAVRAADRAHRRQLDDLCAFAADLRAGLPPPVAAAPAAGTDRITALTLAAVRLAEQTGAPLADLVERIEADARAMDRGLASAQAQAAGARATAWLLAGLPIGGIALGYGIGVDPLDVLLHTPVGAGCAVGAIVLQLAGLGWADRLSGGAVQAP